MAALNILPTGTADQRWRDTLKLEIFVFARETRKPPIIKLSQAMVAFAQRDSQRQGVGGEGCASD